MILGASLTSTWESHHQKFLDHHHHHYHHHHCHQKYQEQVGSSHHRACVKTADADKAVSRVTRSTLATPPPTVSSTRPFSQPAASLSDTSVESQAREEH